jgi:hypothetical protein
LGLTAFGFVFGPFVYYGHEWAWDHFEFLREEARDASASPELLPAPGRPTKLSNPLR